MSNEVEVESVQSSNKNEYKDLKAWLAKSNCQHLLSKFVENGITFDLLPALDSFGLKELGVSKVGDRLRLEIAISELKTQHLEKCIDINELYQKLHLEMSSQVGASSSGELNRYTPSDGTFALQSSYKDVSQANLAQQNSAPVKDTNKNITFILHDGSIKRVNVAGCFNAQAIKRKVAKKLGFKTQEAQFDTYIHSSHDENRNYYERYEPSVIMLYDVELVTICYSPERLEKHRIILVPKDETPTQAAIETSRMIMDKYSKGVSHSNALGESNSPSKQYKERERRLQKSTLRNFFGQRPPSELISSNLAEYFPDTRQSDLEKTVRNSVRHSVRLSRRFNLPLGAFSSSSVAVHKRASIMSNSTGIPSQRTLSISSAEQITGGIRQGQKTVGDIVMNNITSIDEAVNSRDTLNMFNKPSTSFNNQGLNIGLSPPMLAQSHTNSAAPNLDASLRSFSGGGGGGGGSSSKAIHRISISTNYSDNPINNRHSTIELMNTSDDSEGEEDEYNEYVASESGLLASDTENRVPENWLKGAKIGSGSFGTVYLGMNPYTGELMVVKQIPLRPNSQSTQSSQQQHQTEEHGMQKRSAFGQQQQQQQEQQKQKQKQSLSSSSSSSDPLQKIMAEQQREMTFLKELNHENIVRYFGSSIDDQYLNIFLEYIPGGSVQSMLNSYGPFEEPLIRNFIRQVLIGLSYLHGEDIIHRDIKGANILIDIKGTVKIGDFGISKKVSTINEEDDDFKKTGKRASLQGSVFWMAPEVVKQTTYTKKADIWSVGCVIVEMFTGRHPFPGLSQMQALFKIGNHVSPEIPEWCTMEAKAFLKKTFELNFEKRPNAVELLPDQFLNPLIMSKQ
ncbi:STE11 [Candida oxycetoniae]|uniref:mitogen-activated protein kinase kinase kinase n=1 Tax=Candida oxycetoniae TaxID=497107 RepID=A0AAI9STJ7_9ASCO|nr:STE11 [Candida oxycetoniae]KAI3402366.2 STE11 [Candida oxycetoniae]